MYFETSTNIFKDLSDKFELLEILYKGQKIKNLTITKIIFWNNGKETIKKEDIVPSDPLVLEVDKGFQILDVKIFPNNSSSKFTYSISDDLSTAKLDFDYIDKNEGAVIQISHSGYSSENIQLKGKIMGVGEPIRRQKTFKSYVTVPIGGITIPIFRKQLIEYQLKIKSEYYAFGFASLFFLISLILNVGVIQNTYMILCSLFFSRSDFYCDWNLDC